MLTSVLPDQELVKKYLRGDNTSFEILLTRHKSRVFAFIMSKIKNRDIENVSKYITKPVKNLIIDRSTSSIDLLKDSKLCIGFNSTALIESSAFNIPTINFVPEHIYKKYNDYIIEYKSLVINTADYDLIKNKIAVNTIRTKPDKVKLNDLNDIVGNNTGNVKEIIVESVLNLINNDKI